VQQVTEQGNACGGFVRNPDIGCLKMSFTTLKAYMNLFEDMYSILECRNVEKYTQFCLG
jgi:hypothetical protein